MGFYSFVVDLTKQLRHLCVLNIFCQTLQIILIHLIAQKHLNWFHLQLRSLEGILCSMIARIHWLPFGCGQWKMLETSHIGVKWAKGVIFQVPRGAVACWLLLLTLSLFQGSDPSIQLNFSLCFHLATSHSLFSSEYINLLSTLVFLNPAHTNSILDYQILVAYFSS